MPELLKGLLPVDGMHAHNLSQVDLRENREKAVQRLLS